MNYIKETLTRSSLSKMRILCKLENGNFACFEIENLNDLISELSRIEKILKNEGINTNCVIIPIQLFLTESFYRFHEMTGCTEWEDTVKKSMGIFASSVFVLYNPDPSFNIEL